MSTPFGHCSFGPPFRRYWVSCWNGFVTSHTRGRSADELIHSEAHTHLRFHTRAELACALRLRQTPSARITCEEMGAPIEFIPGGGDRTADGIITTNLLNDDKMTSFGDLDRGPDG